MRSKLVLGNWKMNGCLHDNQLLLEAILSKLPLVTEGVDVGVCVSSPYLAQVQNILQSSKLAWGAQDVSDQLVGAYTGEISASMLLEFGCRWTLIGHSERRIRHLESDHLVSSKVHVALAAGLTPVVCIGDTSQEKEHGRSEEVVTGQLVAVLKTLSVQQLSSLVIAYEPVWAIGAGKSASSSDVQSMHSLIRRVVADYNADIAANTLLLYGGSVKSNNALELMSQPDVDGVLVGGAALIADEFLGIVSAALASR